MTATSKFILEAVGFGTLLGLVCILTGLAWWFALIHTLDVIVHTLELVEEVKSADELWFIRLRQVLSRELPAGSKETPPECPICFETPMFLVKPECCDHLYCLECLRQWIQDSDTAGTALRCTVCRRSVAKEQLHGSIDFDVDAGYFHGPYQKSTTKRSLLEFALMIPLGKLNRVSSAMKTAIEMKWQPWNATLNRAPHAPRRDVVSRALELWTTKVLRPELSRAGLPRTHDLRWEISSVWLNEDVQTQVYVKRLTLVPADAAWRWLAFAKRIVSQEPRLLHTLPALVALPYPLYRYIFTPMVGWFADALAATWNN